MVGDGGRTTENFRNRTISRSGSEEYDRRGPRRLVDDQKRRVEDGGVQRKRYRSRSRDEPRKRRSLSLDNEDRGQRSRERSYRQRHREGKSDKYRSKRRRSLSASRSPTGRKAESPIPFTRSKGPLQSQQDAFKGEGDMPAKDLGSDKQNPNFGNTGRLAAAANTVLASGGQSIILKYHEPSEARKPSAKDPWRMYVFKGDEIVDTIQLAEQSCWLFGREAAVVDFMIEHPSCSKQHAVLQFRYMEKRNEYGDKTGKVRPYIIDLDSANGTTVNDERLPERRYVELRNNDVVKFGHSSREYVMQLPSSL